MEDNEVLRQLSQLKTIKPRNSWARSLRSSIILQENKKEKLVRERVFVRTFVSYIGTLVRTPAIGFAAIFILVIGGIGAERSLPGDRLYSVKATFQNARLSLVPEGDRTSAYLALANQRLDDLREIANKNQIANLHPTILELEGQL